MQMHRLRSGAAATLLWTSIVLSLGGCAATSTYRHAGFVGSRGTGLTLSVVNRNIEDVRVYILRETTTMPIGTVRAMNSRAFKIPKARLGCSSVLRLAVVTTPSHSRHNLAPLEYNLGQTVEARIGTFLNNSQLYATPVPHDY